jgi:hypothetical protein
VNFFLTLFKARFIEPRLIRFNTGWFSILVGKTRLTVHLKRSQILSITSLIQVLLLSPWPCWIYRWSIIFYYHHRYFLLSNYLMFLISTPYFLMSTVVCVLIDMLQWTILLRIPWQL